MKKQPTKRQKEDQIIEEIIKKILLLEKTHGTKYTRSACQRYANRRREEKKLKTEIKEREEELNKLKNKVK